MERLLVIFYLWCFWNLTAHSLLFYGNIPLNISFCVPHKERWTFSIRYSFKPLLPLCKYAFLLECLLGNLFFFFSASRTFCMTFSAWSLFILHSNSNSQLFVTFCTSANWTSSRVSFASRYTTALEIKARRYERRDLLHSSMHSSDENLLLSFTQEAIVYCEIIASLNWNNSKMSHLFDLSRIKKMDVTHSAFRPTIRPDVEWRPLLA